ncbi:hypothetical protein BGZ80_011099 [Entomortierella chlamydospora]|uniref:Uncharacterized protein n=1 Tax=Entomortierella chlamydospora TaxID=101097 RepID=A0A9P6MV44_9FUNG|nr:hypothetical protein BGZ80_011099 [Entomortierella chlamydospora]
MSVEPIYLGSDVFEPNEVKGVHTFFQKHEVAKWTATSFLSEYPSDLKEFSESLDLIVSVKSVGRPIRTYCYKIMQFLDSIEGQTHIRILQAQSRTSQNSTLIRENTFEAFQKDIIDDQTAKLKARHAKRARQESSVPLSPTRNETKGTESRYSTEEPWHSLTHSLMEVRQFHVDIDRVAMSCCLNVMSDRACKHFENHDKDGLLDAARTSSVIEGFELHECTNIAKRYTPFLAENTVEDLKKKLSIDIGALNQKYVNTELPASAKLEEKVLEILKQLDEKALEASKIMRQHQASEYNEVSESARKVDCLFMYEGLELSNIEFKKPDTSVHDLAIQNRKNVRLGRCIQEAHIAVGVQEPSVMMADVAGFVGIFYQVKKMGDIAIAGKTTSTTVALPQDAESFDRFLEDGSLAIMWNFISHLEKQGQKVLRAKQRYDAMSRSTKFV